MKYGKVEFSNQKYLKGREKFQPFKLKMLDLIPTSNGWRVLDIGCGTGIVTEKLIQKGWNVIGLDISFEAMKRYSDAGFIGLISNAEDSLPFKNNSFDAIWLSEVIEHVVDYQTMITEIGRLLKSDGCVYLTAPNSVFYGYRLMYLIGKCPSELQHPYHVRFFSPKYLSSIFQLNGFKVEMNFGQNIYMVIPHSLIRAVKHLSNIAEKLILKLINLLGFKKVEGLIHGDKYLYYNFSSFFHTFFSNTIMIVARKRTSADV